MKYLSFICGGTGPDTWDKEEIIDAVDFEDAFKQAKGKIEGTDGWIYSIEQCGEYPPKSTKAQLQELEWRLGSIERAHECTGDGCGVCEFLIPKD